MRRRRGRDGHGVDCAIREDRGGIAEGLRRRVQGRVFLAYFRLGIAEPGKRPQRMKIARSEEHTSELQSLMSISYAVFCLKKKRRITTTTKKTHNNTSSH